MTDVKSNSSSLIFVIILCVIATASGLVIMYYMRKKSGLTNVSSCNTTDDIEGWPDQTLAQYIDPSSSGPFTGAAACATACEKASTDVQAAIYLSNGECKCYKNWNVSSACYTDPHFGDIIPTLITKSADTLCSSGTPLPKCQNS